MAQQPYYPPQGAAPNAQIRPDLFFAPPSPMQGSVPQNRLLPETPRPVATSGIQVPQEKEQEESANERLMVFSDAVIAFAITITAIPLKVAKLTRAADIFKSQFSVELVFYIFSFFLIYGLWREHHAIFHHIRRNNGWLIALNMLFLAMIVCIPVGFIILLSGYNHVFDGSKLTSDDFMTIGYGALLYLGAQFCAILILLVTWWSAHLRPAALFGEKAPEKPFRVYMSWRLFFQVLSFVAYAATIMLVLIEPSLFLVGVGILVLCLGPRWLVLGLYHRRHRQVLDFYLGGEDPMRIQLFSDAVFAVAVTITVAQIDPAADAAENFSLLGTYVFSFLILGIYWLLHYRVFLAIRCLNRTLVMLNFWFLLLIILAFIPARMYTGNMYDNVRAVLFSVYQVLTAGILWVIWRYTKRHRVRTERALPLLKERISLRQSKRLDWIIGLNPCIFLVLAIVAFFTPILSPLYIIAYLALLGLLALIVQAATHSSSTLPLIQK